MKKKSYCIIALLLLFFATGVFAQSDEPTISPIATIVEGDKAPVECTEYDGSAPLEATFRPQTLYADGLNAYYEWRFYKEGGDISKPYLVRHEEETSFTFFESGTHCVALIAYFVEGNDTIARFDEEYWATATPIRITVSESKLEFPNAFSPNGDGVNDIYRAKEGYRSIIDFKATIYNRQGQKIYEWTDVSQGWDGTFHGTDVKQGVYYVHVSAKGADGRVYNIRRDVNLLRGFTEVK